MKTAWFFLIAVLLCNAGYASVSTSGTDSISKKGSIKNAGSQMLFHPAVVYFEKNSYQSDELSSVIKKFVEETKKIPNATFIVSGYADPDGTEAYNRELSEKRANEIKEELIKLGIKDSRITVNAFGESQSENLSPTDYSTMRKVEVKTIVLMK